MPLNSGRHVFLSSCIICTCVFITIYNRISLSLARCAPHRHNITVLIIITDPVLYLPSWLDSLILLIGSVDGARFLCQGGACPLRFSRYGFSTGCCQETPPSHDTPHPVPTASNPFSCYSDVSWPATVGFGAGDGEIGAVIAGCGECSRGDDGKCLG